MRQVDEFFLGRFFGGKGDTFLNAGRKKRLCFEGEERREKEKEREREWERVRVRLMVRKRKKKRRNRRRG